MKKITRVPFFGAFTQETRDVINSAVSREGPDATIINLCSGSWGYGITLDRNTYEGFDPPHIIADVQALPFRDGIADVIIFDPPFSKKFKAMYKGAYYANRRQVFQEVLRILKPGGLLIFSHYFVPHFRVLTLEAIYMIHNRPWEHIRALSFLRKQKTLLEIYDNGDNPEKNRVTDQAPVFSGASVLKKPSVAT